MLFSTFLVRRGLITPMQLIDAQEIGQTGRPQLGLLAMESGVLNVRQVFQILAEQAESHKPFGQIAKDLGFLTERTLSELLVTQASMTKPVDQILVEMGAIEEAVLKGARADFYRVAADGQEVTELVRS